MSCLAVVQRIFLTQGLNPGLLHCRQILYLLSHQGSFVLILHRYYYYYYLRSFIVSSKKWYEFEVKHVKEKEFFFGGEAIMR